MIKQPYIHNFSYLFTAFLFILFTCNPVTIQLVDRNVIYNPLMPLVMNPKILVVTLPYNGMDQDLNWFFKLRTDYSVQSSESFKYLDQSPRPNSTDLSIIKLIYPWVSQSRVIVQQINLWVYLPKKFFSCQLYWKATIVSSFPNCYLNLEL